MRAQTQNDENQVGHWAPAFDHPTPAPAQVPNWCNGEPFIAVHGSLIPVGPFRGWVLVWDKSESAFCIQNASLDRIQRWAVVNPETGQIFNDAFTIPAAVAPSTCSNGPGGNQGLFCAGHCWLPDGTLLVAGGDDWIPLGPTTQTASWYMDGTPAPTKPTITSAPTTLGYGQTFRVDFTLPFGQNVSRIVLISPGSVTHSHDPNQRFVQMEFTEFDGSFADVVAPGDRSLAPPGFYMVFLVSSAGTPSVATWVRLG